MPGGIHFLFGLLLFYIFQWIAFLVDATRRRKRSLSSSIAINNNATTTSTVQQQQQQLAKSNSNSSSSSSLSKIADSSITSTVENPSKVCKTLSSSLEVDPCCETSIKSSSTSLPHHSECCYEKTAASTSTYASKPAFSIGGEDGLTPILHRIYYRKSDREWFQYGLLVGSILPDIDLCVVILTIILSFLFLGWGPDQHKEVAETLHRGATHSLVFFLPLLLYFVYLYNEKDRKLVAKMKMQTEQVKVQEEEDESLPTDSEFSAAAPQKNISQQLSEEKTSLSFWEKLQQDHEWLNIPFAIGLLVGFIFHTLLDVIYMKGVKMFWPIYTEEIFVEVPWLYLLDNFKYPPMVQKLIMTIDHSSEVLFYLAIIFYRSCTKRNMEKQMKAQKEIKEAKPIDQNSKQPKEIEEPHNTFINLWNHLKNLSLKDFILELWNASEDDWDLVFRYACVVQLVVIWLAFFLMYVFFPDIDFVQFVIYIYFPGTVFVLLSLLAPFCFKTTLSSWDFSNVFSSTPRHPRPIISHQYHSSSSSSQQQHHIKSY
ncbi:predicted protein [Naegleria gruberi]|uniref:Predicted protein n=1 Tax=Naegleria gruberi TaxID=5762 RepID=D2VGG2_NAEGR|nr:uncharacterized protein NAEGRDRAFT_79886 [Naegleria gruberi]EFC44060.1 predicted protein [Naegleria gruberi]|eukprot:XP_002676804.1 predicted protein [Naegleria gruberi strain NEG-M]